MSDVDLQSVKQVAESVGTIDGWSVRDWQSVVFILAAVVGLPLAVWRSWVAHKQARIAENGQNLDRYQKGAQMLGDERMSVRQGGILAVRDLALSNAESKRPDGQGQDILDLLAAFIHERSEEADKKKGSGADPPDNRISADTKMALDAISRINRKRISTVGLDLLRSVDHGRHSVDLYDASLRGVRTFQLEFSGMALSHVDLKSATLVSSFFTKSSMSAVDLRKASVWGSYFESAVFRTSSFKEAFFCDCDFTDAAIIDCHMGDTQFHRCKFKNVDFSRSDWTGAILKDHDLSEDQIKVAQKAGAAFVEVVEE